MSYICRRISTETSRVFKGEFQGISNNSSRAVREILKRLSVTVIRRKISDFRSSRESKFQ
jgi:hypothetical protein